MAILTRKEAKPEGKTLSVRLDTDVVSSLRAYARYLNRTPAEVVNAAIKHAIHQDKEFQAATWVTEEHPTTKRGRKAKAVGGD